MGKDLPERVKNVPDLDLMLLPWPAVAVAGHDQHLLSRHPRLRHRLLQRGQRRRALLAVEALELVDEALRVEGCNSDASRVSGGQRDE